MNTSEQTDSPKCPKCHIKDHVISEFHKLIQTKEATIVDKVKNLRKHIAAINK